MKKDDRAADSESRIFSLRLPGDVEKKLEELQKRLAARSDLARPHVTKTDAILTALDAGLQTLLKKA